MSVFLVQNCKFDQDCYANVISWSHTDPIAAVTTYSVDEQDRETNQVLFVNNEGITIPGSVISHDHEATSIEWQPDSRLLVVGWNDGLISCWIVDGRSRPISTFSNSTQHGASITVMKWSPSGKRLITGDKRGLVCVWSADARGTLSPIRQYKRKGAITAITHCLLPMRPENSNLPKSKIDNKANSSPSFFFGTDQGALVYADDLGHCADVQQMPSSVDVMLFFEEKSRLIIITRSLLLTQYQVAEDGRVSRIGQVKLSITGDVAETGLKSVVWAAPGVIAMASHEKFIRLLDVASDESYNLSLSAAGDAIQKNDRVVSVAFNRNERYIAFGTKLGAILVWKYVGAVRDLLTPNVEFEGTGAGDWELVYKTQLQGSVPTAVFQLSWHDNQGALGAVTEEGVVVLSEMNMQGGICGDLAVVQTGSHDVNVLVVGSPDSWIQNTGILVKGLSVGRSCYVIWSGKDARAFRVDMSIMRMEALESFSTPSTAMAIADSTQVVEESLFIADQCFIRVTNFSGVQKASISFSEAEGIVQHLDINDRILAAVTDKGVIGVYDVHTPKKPKALGSTGRFFETINSSTPLNIRYVRVNCDGSRVAIIADQIEGSLKVRHPDTKLYVYDRIKGSVHIHDFNQYNRYPVRLGWDANDSRMFACEAVRNRTVVSRAKDTRGPESEPIDEYSEVEVFTLFASSEHGIIMQDSFPRRAPFGSFLGLSVPRLFFRNAPMVTTEDDIYDQSPLSPSVVRIMSKVMRDFIGMEDITESTKIALLDFSFNLTLGKLDEAYKAVKMIGNPALWENMAHMCVKTKRLDVAEVCLGNMGHVRGAAAVRESKKEGNLDVSIGVLAIQLGLYDEAIKLFQSANRPDLISKLYEAAGLWEKAIKTSTANDRVHTKTTHFKYAKHLESIGDIDGAIKHYKISDTYRTEVPRMLYSLDRIEELEDFVRDSDDEVLLKWWAAYLESKNKFDGARKYYSKANDNLSLVRILCFKGEFDKAADIINDSGDKAAAYHFARQLENQQAYQDAISFYAIAGCYNHSIRLAKAHDLDSELMRFAMKSTPSLMLDCAQHFEAKGEYDKAVQLYQKGGDYPKALDLCFRVSESDPTQTKVMFDMMNGIAQELGSSTSPQTLARCAEFLVNHKQYEKAIELYVLANRPLQAIEMCIQHKINISEELAQKLTPPESASDNSPASVNERKEILKELARALKRQGSYALASRKYTQAGDRIRAIKCLVKSGDTKAVIQFATISRNAEIYTLAANYLQQMNWRESVEIMKSIIMFYTKAKSWEQMARFYDSCGIVEIDEYRDYDKAIEALKEALKYMHKIEPSQLTRSQEDMINMLEKRIGLMEKFVDGREAMARGKADSGVSILQELLQEPMLEEAIRSGDCYAMLVEHYYQQRQMVDAYHYLMEMEDRRIPLNPYLDAEIIDTVFLANGRKQGSQAIASPKFQDQQYQRDDDDVVDEEEVDEVMEEDEEEAKADRYGNKSRPNYGRK